MTLGSNGTEEPRFRLAGFGMMGRAPHLLRERGMDEHHLSELGPDGLEPGGDYAGVVLRDYELTQRGLDGISLEGSLLSKIRATGIPLARLRLSDAIVRDCDFANAAWARARFTAVSLSKCRLTGWNVADSVFRKVEFVGCKIDLAVFHNAMLTDCQFHACDLRETDFQGATLKNVTFRRCDLRSVRFAAASLRNVDFRGSHLAGIVLDPHSLSSNVFEPSQLLDVAQVLGLEVRDIEDEGLPRRH